MAFINIHLSLGEYVQFRAFKDKECCRHENVQVSNDLEESLRLDLNNENRNAEDYT